MADVSNLKINERLNLPELLQQKMKIKKINFPKFIYYILKGKDENWQDCEWCEIPNGQTIRKFANFWNFDSFKN